MEITGYVQSTDGKYVNVKIIRQSACGGNCASCGGCGGKEQIVRALNSAGAVCGNKVSMRMDSKKVLFAAFIAYILPIISLFAVYAAVFAVSRSETVSAASSVAALLLTLFFTHIADKKLKDNYTLIAVRLL